MSSTLEIKELDQSGLSAWDNFVVSHKAHTPYHLSAWSKAVDSAYGHQCHFVAAFDQEEIVGIMPLVQFTIPFKSPIMFSLPFCDLAGPLANSDEVKNALYQYGLELGKKLNTRGVVVRERITQEHNVDNQEGSLDGKKVSMLLPIDCGADELLASFKSKLRSQIRKAEKNGLTVETGTDKRLLNEFYQVFSQNMHRLGSPVHSKQWFENIVSEYGENCLISVVRSEAEAIGAGIILFSKSQVCIPWASTLVEYNRLSPNMLLYWSFLSFSAGLGAKVFDFGRSTFNEGTYRFKAQWGAKPQELRWMDLTQPKNQENCSAEPSKIRALVENVWKKMPLPIVNTIGPKVRKYISL